MADFFFYGTLCHAPLLRVVLGRDYVPEPARLPGYVVHWAKDQPFPTIEATSGRYADGVLLRGLTPEDVARLDFYEGGFDYDTRDVSVINAEGPVTARVYFPTTQRWQAGAPWSLADWVSQWGAVAVATAGDFMALIGERSAPEVLQRYGQMLVRGASRVRAADAAPTTLRRHSTGDDIRIATRRQPYANFFAVEEYDLSYRRFDGSFSKTVNRAAFVSGDAVTVLPYDPVRDRILLIEQFRTGPMARGDSQPWLLEVIAGRVDPDETPEQAARREAVEEAGLTLGAMLPVSNYYPSPGGKAEFIYSYVALCDLPDDCAGTFGVASEAEDIRGHLVGFADMMAMVESGEIGNAPLVLTAFWLALNRDALRKA